MKIPLEEGQLVLCKVVKIVGTTVFVKIEEYGLDGTISFPEVAPGRIRNIRDYAFPGKKIVCKILSIKPGSVELSLRRVKVNEKNEFNERYKKEKSYIALLKSIVDKPEEIINKIREQEKSLFDFFESSKENPKILTKYFQKEQAERIAKILQEKNVREILVSKRFSLSNKESNGIAIVKMIVKEASKNINPEISYISAGKYLARLKSKDPKQAESQLKKMLINIETLAKKYSCEFKED